MKFLIKIDPKSIKKNPDAGQTSLNEYISSECYITITGDHESLENDDVRMVYKSGNVSAKNKYTETTRYITAMRSKELELYLDSLVEKHGKNVNYTVQNHFQELNFIVPSPPYLFKYKDKKVKCSHCKSTFSYKNLIDESDYDYDGNFCGIRNGCPSCREPDCCEIEFESIKGKVLSELGLPALVVK